MSQVAVAREREMAFRRTVEVEARNATKRVAILIAAVETLGEAGVEATSIKLVAARAKVAVGLVYHYFPDRAELLKYAGSTLAQRDITDMRAVTGNGASRLAGVLAVLVDSITDAKCNREAMGRIPTYRDAVTSYLSSLFEEESRHDGRAGEAAKCVLATLLSQPNFAGKRFALLGLGLRPSEVDAALRVTPAEIAKRRLKGVVKNLEVQ